MIRLKEILNYIRIKLNKISFLYKPVKYILIITLSVFVLLVGFLLFWYNYCFFPNDQDYLQKIADSVQYKGNFLEEKDLDLIRELGKAKISKPLSKKDREFLLSSGLREKDLYVDENPYGSNYSNNLKYSTGRIFYYVYQKNSLVLKSGSSISFALENKKAKSRFVEFDAAFAGMGESPDGVVNIYYVSGSRRILLSKKILREKKPDIKPFRYSSVLSSISFYLRHPGRSVLTNYTGWEKIRVKLPLTQGKLEIEFKANNTKTSNNYLFLGSPAVYAVYDNKRNDHVNIVYLIFDTLSKSHIDLYEDCETFEKHDLSEAYKMLGKRRIKTPAIDKYKGRICLFDHMITVGQVTRASIVPLWTSQIYTKSRLPVFRNIVTDENRDEFNHLGFASLGNELSKNGYFTKQISCNAQGHGISGVGVDLGFDENYDYTMEATVKPENFRRIMEFLNENQNRKFFLYSHINLPHPPKWIPMKYFLSSLVEAHFNTESAKMIGNIKYFNDSIAKLFDTVEKLKLLENTAVIITADHSGGRIPYLRGEINEKDILSWNGDSQSVATFHPRAIYGRGGNQHLLNMYMNIPWVLIKPSNTDFIPGKIDSYISSLDITPTFLDITLNKTNNKFSGKSFKNVLLNKDKREKPFSAYIPMVGRFQRGFIQDGQYKYWINIQGLYKYRVADGKKYIMQQEYLYDLENDPNENYNLIHDNSKSDLLAKMRKIYFNKYVDYPDKNFFQISPSQDGATGKYAVTVYSSNGKIVYPKIYGEGITYKYASNRELVFTCDVNDKAMFFSFETDPYDSKLKISIRKNDKMLDRRNIYSSVECINYFDNPIVLNERTDFHIAREHGKTGLEIKDIPAECVYFSRIPLNYWMEMNLSDKDIKLSAGIKEVLRGWGYIQ